MRALRRLVRNGVRAAEGKLEEKRRISGDGCAPGALRRAAAIVLLVLMLPVCASAQDLDVLMEQFGYAVDDMSGMDTADQSFEGIYIDPQTFADALGAENTALEMLSRLPLSREDAADYATMRNARLRTFIRPSGSYAVVMLPLSGYDTASFFFSRRYADDAWTCIGMFDMGDVMLVEDENGNAWFSGTQRLHGTGVAGTQIYLYSPERHEVVLSYTTQYRDYPLSDRSVELIGSLMLGDGEAAVKHYLRGEGLWAGEATVVDFYTLEEGSFCPAGRTIMDRVDVIGTENRLNVSDLKEYLGL